jgi:hypothetical protein
MNQMPVRLRHAVLAPALAVLLLAGAAGASTTSQAQAAAYVPPPGKVYAGVTGGLRQADYMSFASLVGRHQPVWQLFLTWDQDRGENPYLYLRARLQDAAALHTRLMLSLTTATRGGGEFITPAGIASGSGDRYLLGLNREIGASGQVVYVRPYGEMNQATNAYSAYGPRGRRNAAHSTANFRRAWRRTVLIVRGGDVAVINARLAANRMAPVRTSSATLPVTRTAFVWCPQVAGNPDVAGNAPRAYYPGSSYVDWVGTDFYSGFPNWSGLERFYRDMLRTRKPFAFGEYGIYESGDAPGFISRLLRFSLTHSRVRMALFNQGNEAGGPFRLQRYPRSAAALRAGLRDRRFAAYP